MGLEVCATLGMLNPEQARQLKAAGLTAYNHNLDTSPEYYPKVITTRWGGREGGGGWREGWREGGKGGQWSRCWDTI